jgi:hypothetical protein
MSGPPRPRTLLAAALLSCLSVAVSALGQSDHSGQSAMHDQAAQTPGAGKAVSLIGCLDSGFQFTDKEGNLHQLVGATSGLNKYVGAVIQVEGTVSESAEPLPSFHVMSVRQISRAAAPQLSAAFRNEATWRAEENQRYGLKFSHPVDFTTREDSDAENESNFPIQDGSVLLGSFDFPDIYKETNFRGGHFNLFVNPKIRNRESCEQFGRSDPKDVTLTTIGSVRFVVSRDGGAAAGTAYVDRDFHIFRNGLCYEFGFEFGEVNTRNYDLWCTIPSLSDEDEWNVVRPLLGEVSFVQPEPPIIRENSAGAPKVNSFNATQTINSITKLSETTFSWSTQNFDFIELSYKCPSGSNGMVIAEGGEQRGCGNSLDQSFPIKRSPNGSVAVNLANFDHDDPVPVVVTMTPFSGAIPDRDLSKSVTVSVGPWNPLLHGAHTGTQNMTLGYADGATKRYRQGSSMAIRWTDTEKRDPCVNLFLVQDNEQDVVEYRARFGERKCQTPASGGTVSWQLPQRYRGSGFRIYAVTPGDGSWALGERFEIVP